MPRWAAVDTVRADLWRLTPAIKLTALDQDAQALEAARQKLAEFGERVSFRQCNFAEFDPGEQQFAGILADLGVSSAQFDWSERGFSFRQDAPLDMRMNQQQGLTAAEIVNHWEEVRAGQRDLTPTAKSGYLAKLPAGLSSGGL